MPDLGCLENLSDRNPKKKIKKKFNTGLLSIPRNMNWKLQTLNIHLQAFWKQLLKTTHPGNRNLQIRRVFFFEKLRVEGGLWQLYKGRLHLHDILFLLRKRLWSSVGKCWGWWAGQWMGINHTALFSVCLKYLITKEPR